MLTKLYVDDKVLVRRYSINRISLVSISENNNMENKEVSLYQKI